MMMKCVMLMLAVVVTGCAGCRTDRAPEHKMIEMAFFKCEKCRSLEGGIYGKGPFKSLHTPEAKACVHEWQAIGMEEFKILGTEWRGLDWTNEIPFWNPETNGVPNQASQAIGASAPQPER
jgi:hypothetical protein